MLLKLIIIFILTQLRVVENVNYCYLPCDNQTHSACKRCGVSVHCMSSQYYEYVVTKADRTAILDAHNELRNEMAAGRKSFSFLRTTIKDMRIMNYHSELEQIALCWVRRCFYNPDPCPRTEFYPDVKQNIFEMDISVFWGCSYGHMVQAALTVWWNDFQRTHYDLVTCIDGHNCTDQLNQVLWSENNFIGCAMVRHRHTRTDKCLIACNYAPGYVSGTLFDFGPAAKCKIPARGFDSLYGRTIDNGVAKNHIFIINMFMLCLIFFLFIIKK